MTGQDVTEPAGRYAATGGWPRIGPAADTHPLHIRNEGNDMNRMEVVMSGKITLSGSERSNLAWQKAQSSTVNGQCIEIASTADKIAIRDSKDPNGPILVYTLAEFSAFLEGARNGEFDGLVR
jgi:hypothetical protein